MTTVAVIDARRVRKGTWDCRLAANRGHAPRVVKAKMAATVWETAFP
jgi:hypothetical protein